MKLILRADDLGFSEGVNCGITKAVKDGLITSVGMMSNMESASHGYNLIKDCDIALGLHTNICAGKPVSDPRKIPTLVNGEEFCSSREIRSRSEDLVNLSECEIEVQAQLDRFREIVGRDPDYLEGHAVASRNFFKALENVAKRNNIFFENVLMDKEWEEKHNLYAIPFPEYDENGLYDPLKVLNDYLPEIKEKGCMVMVFHPGYLDQYILTHSSFTLIRAMECDFLCSQELKDFIKENNIELVDFRDYTF